MSDKKIYRGLIKVKDSAILHPFVKYLKTRHPNFWVKGKYYFYFFDKKNYYLDVKGLENLDEYTKDFFHTLMLEIEISERRRTHRWQ